MNCITLLHGQTTFGEISHSSACGKKFGVTLSASVKLKGDSMSTTADAVAAAAAPITITIMEKKRFYLLLRV